MQQKNCKTHFEPIVLNDDKNQQQCKTCLENESFDRMMKVEKAIIEYKDILNQSKDTQEIMKIQKTLDLISKYKISLPQSFERRRNLYKQFQQPNILQENKYKKVNYKLINEYPNMKDCWSFVFNQDLTQLFIGQKHDIKVFEFKDGEIKKELQTLEQHASNIICLIYMNKSNLLVSGSCDETIVIWNQDQNGNWIFNQILKDRQNWIFCLIHNEDEDLLISGSNNKTIKFWKKIDMKWYCYQTIGTVFCVYSLSLSKSQKRLISCGWNSNSILIMEQKSNQQWIRSQTIHTNNYGIQLLFINDNQFVYQAANGYNLQIYIYDQVRKQFMYNKEIILENNYYELYHNNVFPCKYIEQKHILIIKNDKYLNILGIDQQQNYIPLITKRYDRDFFGNISNNGQYVIIGQDRYSSGYGQKQIEVRELQYPE